MVDNKESLLLYIFPMVSPPQIHKFKKHTRDTLLVLDLNHYSSFTVACVSLFIGCSLHKRDGAF